jgi:hypothetical protein
MKVSNILNFSFQSLIQFTEQLNQLILMMITNVEYFSKKEWVNKFKLIH